MSEKLSSGQLGSIERVIHDLRDDMYDLEYFVDHGYNLTDEFISEVNIALGAINQLRQLCENGKVQVLND